MSNKPIRAKVAVSAATYWVDKPYDYVIPEKLAESVKPGVRVLVPFGAGNKRTEGIVLAIGEAFSERECKPIASVLDAESVLSPELLRLALWIRERYFCTVYDAVHAMLPAGLWYKIESAYAIVPGMDRERAYEVAGKSTQEKLILDAVFAHDGSCPRGDLDRVFEDGDPARPLQALVKKGVLQTDSREKRRVGDKCIRMVSLRVSPAEAQSYAQKREKRAPLQSAVVRLLCTLERVSYSELCYFTGASASTVNALEKAEIVSVTAEEVFRRPVGNGGELMPIPPLNEDQSKVFEELCTLSDAGKASASLLYGVTGSGKTMVYIHLIERILVQGRGAILLVPEISLTPQMIRIFSSYFGERVAVLHSSLSVGERYDEWKRVRSGGASVVIGTRSAVFAPVQNLGLVIIDEEQEYTYKSENTPRYHARDVAKFRCAEADAMLLLGSATPDLESRYLAKNGRYHFLRLPGRYNRQVLPRVDITDMRSELKDGNGISLSRHLIDEIGENLRRGEQSILFLNRRGTSSLVACGECGYTYSCPRCSVNLTWHASGRKLMCHHCGYTHPLDAVCPECGGELIHYGTGTQKLEEELREVFPETEILRMDADTVSPSGSHEKILSEFREKRVPILIGTQMVTKGLDFENVTLVGVISADQSLYCGDYRSAERCFSLITQVVGRSGRGSKPGRAVIQTYTPGNQVIRLAAEQDYDAFYETEIAMRSLQYCPPFADIVTITANGENESTVLRCCRDFRDFLQKELSHRADVRILGPAPLPVVRVNNRFRYSVTVHANFDKEIRTTVSGLLVLGSTAKEYKGVSVFADLNPME